MKNLNKLNRLPKLDPIKSVDFDSLIKTWKNLLYFAAKRYSLPVKLDFEDVYQEVCLVAWALSKKVNPYKYPVDYRKLLKTEIFNKAIDMVRFHKTKKRLAFLGWLVECNMCGNTSSFRKEDVPVCPMCGHPVVFRMDTEDVKWKQSRPIDVSLNSEYLNQDEILINEDDDAESSYDLNPQYIDQSLDEYLVDDLKKEFNEKFDSKCLENQLFYFLLEPTDEQRKFLIENDLERKARLSYKMLSKYFDNFSESAIKKAYKNMSTFIYGYIKNDN
jgi:DNA-directed RNA polymerase specialized sigma24 family protein